MTPPTTPTSAPGEVLETFETKEQLLAAIESRNGDHLPEFEVEYAFRYHSTFTMPRQGLTFRARSTDDARELAAAALRFGMVLGVNEIRSVKRKKLPPYEQSIEDGEGELIAFLRQAMVNDKGKHFVWLSHDCVCKIIAALQSHSTARAGR